MKILFLIDSLYFGGKERQLSELLKGLNEKRDINCELLILSNGIYYSYIQDLNIKIHHLPRRRKGLLILPKLYNLYKHINPDIIHSWDSMSSLYILPIIKTSKKIFISSLIRNAPQKLKIFSKAWTRSKLIFPFSEIILANSYAGLRSYNAPPKKSFCIHNGFDFGRIENIKEKSEILKQFNITTPHIVGMVGKFNKKKDYTTYILAAERILQKRRDVTFLAVGDGIRLETCKALVSEVNKKYIRFLGNQSDAESIINVFDVGVLATFTEGISNAIMEYMAFSKPVIATDGGGTKEILIHNKTGFLVRQSDVEDLANKIEILMDDKSLSTQFGAAGKDRLAKEFNLNKMTERYINFYDNILKGNSKDLN